MSASETDLLPEPDECPFCGAPSHAALLAEVEIWRHFPAPDLERVIVAGVQPKSGGTVAYWWIHEDMTDEKGVPIDHPTAIRWCYLPDRPSENPEEAARAALEQSHDR